MVANSTFAPRSASIIAFPKTPSRPIPKRKARVWSGENVVSLVAHREDMISDKIVLDARAIADETADRLGSITSALALHLFKAMPEEAQEAVRESNRAWVQKARGDQRLTLGLLGVMIDPAHFSVCVDNDGAVRVIEGEPM